MRGEKFVHQLSAQAMIGFLNGLVFHVLAQFRAQSDNGIKIFAEAAGPFVVNFRKFFHGAPR